MAHLALQSIPPPLDAIPHGIVQLLVGIVVIVIGIDDAVAAQRPHPTADNTKGGQKIAEGGGEAVMEEGGAVAVVVGGGWGEGEVVGVAGVVAAVEGEEEME